jgi:putative FmdB family regulatory protein
MPLYEYECPTCGHRCDRLQRLDAPAPVCPKCPATQAEPPTMTRRISLASFHLKGSGWAFDGYKGQG